MIRLNSPINLPAKIEIDGEKHTISPPDGVTKVKDIIIHAHGGGFMGMSSHNH